MASDGAWYALLRLVHHPLKPRVLCIDDEPSAGHLLQCLLEKTGDFVVGVETKSIDAINKARLFRPDLVIMDIKMSGPDGFMVTRNLRQEPALRHKPVLFFSGMPDVEDQVKAAWRSGPTEYLEKGVPAATIEETVRRILAERIKQYHAALAAKAA